MKDTDSSSPMARRLELIKETISIRGMMFPSIFVKDVKSNLFESENRSCLEQELHELCSIGEDALLYGDDASYTKDEVSPTGDALGSHSTLLGESDNTNLKAGVSPEAAATVSKENTSAEKKKETFPWMCESQCTLPVDIALNTKRVGEVEQCRSRRKLYKQKSWSSEVDREEAWERRKDRLSEEHSRQALNHTTLSKPLGRCVSDCGDMTRPLDHGLGFDTRTRSLTDEDLDELRGCFDLGFGFSNQADPRLWDTLPALKLCYAISQQLKDEQAKSTPVSVLDKNAMDSPSRSSSEKDQPGPGPWLISSPGDHPQEVKERLRHWAQAVAFNVRQGY